MQQIQRRSIEQAWESAWNHGRTDALDDVVADDYVRVSKSSGSSVGLADFKDEIVSVREAFPDLSTSIDEFVVEGEKAVIFWTSRGTHTGALKDAPATGRPVVSRGSNVLELSDGRVTKETVTWDSSGILADLGVKSLAAAEAPSADELVVDNFSGEPDQEMMKGFNRKFVTGVTVVTTKDGERPRGLAVNAYCSVSLEPPLVMVCVQKTSSTYPALFKATHLGINILSTDQRETVGTFASKAADKFADLDWHAGPAGSPLIDGSSAALEAEIKERFQAKTHTIFVCRVRHAEVTEAEPMVYKAGKFFDSEELTAL
jgi:steroid delta-isomerase-like uncharacterized protein